MPAEPHSWNVVAIGAWNPAILTPDGVRRRLFELPDNAAIEVEVQFDRPGPFRIGHDGVIVVPSTSRLEVAVRTSTPPMLARACGVAVRALQALPETPVSAAGVNLRYRFADIPDALIDLAKSSVDPMLADEGFALEVSTVKRSIALAPGRLNLEYGHDRANGVIEFNFHRDSKAPLELQQWIERHAEFAQIAERVLSAIGVIDEQREVDVRRDEQPELPNR